MVNYFNISVIAFSLYKIVIIKAEILKIAVQVQKGDKKGLKPLWHLLDKSMHLNKLV